MRLAALAGAAVAAVSAQPNTSCWSSGGKVAPCGPGNEKCTSPQDPNGRPRFHIKDLTCGENDPNFPFFDEVHGIYRAMRCDAARASSTVFSALGSTGISCLLPLLLLQPAAAPVPLLLSVLLVPPLVLSLLLPVALPQRLAPFELISAGTDTDCVYGDAWMSVLLKSMAQT